jgi:hypothetical protein
VHYIRRASSDEYVRAYEDVRAHEVNACCIL